MYYEKIKLALTALLFILILIMFSLIQVFFSVSRFLFNKLHAFSKKRSKDNKKSDNLESLTR